MGLPSPGRMVPAPGLAAIGWLAILHRGVHVCACVCARMCTYIYVCMCACVYVCTCVCVYVCVLRCVCYVCACVSA